MDAPPPPPHEEPNTPTLKYKTWILKVSIHCVGCKRKVKKVLQTIEGVYTIDIDSKQHKVTVIGNVEIDVLLKKLHKTGKHAEKWPENPTRKEKTTAPAADKDHESSTDDEDNDTKSNIINNNSNSNSNSNSNPPPENGNTQSSKVTTSGGPSVKFAGVPENGAAPAGGGKKKKKKKKGKKSNSSGGAKQGASGGVADSGSSTVGGDAGTTTTATTQVVVEQGHLSPPRGYSYPMPGGPAYAVCYSEARPTGNGGASYYIPSIPHTYEEEEEDGYGQFERVSRPSNTFEMLSDENPYGCYVM